jgi:hypothetical protein
MQNQLVVCFSGCKAEPRKKAAGIDRVNLAREVAA